MTARSGDGQWRGTGLSSSAAQANKYTGLACMLNADKDGKAIKASFAGQTVTANDVLVKHTWNGDVNLDGKVDIDDYFLIDSAFIAQSGVLAAEKVPMAIEEAIRLKAAIASRPQPAPSVLAQLFSAKPVI